MWFRRKPKQMIPLDDVSVSPVDRMIVLAEQQIVVANELRRQLETLRKEMLTGGNEDVRADE